MIFRDAVLRSYAALPVPLQDLAFTMAGWRLRRLRYGSVFRERLAGLRETEWCGSAEIAEYQRVQLRALVRHCHDTVPYYRELFDGLRLTPDDIREVKDLAALPILTKEDLRTHHDRLTSSAFPRSDLLRVKTSGTTGSPLEMPCTRAALQFQWAVWWRHRARFGLRLGDPFLAFGARMVVPLAQQAPPFWRRNRAFNQTYLSAAHLTPRHAPAIVEWLNRTDFTFFSGYPSAMTHLAHLVRDGGLPLTSRPRQVVSGSETLLPSSEATLAEVFGAPVTDQYGAAECCANLARCERGVYHEDYEFGIIEPLELDAAGGGPWRRIVATGFANRAFPLLRYDTGDVAVFSEEPCACGRSSRTALRLDGRTEDALRTPDGRLVVGLNQALKHVTGARMIQLVQHEPRQVEVRVVRRPTWEVRDERVLLRELRARVGDAMEIDVVFVDAITPSKSGKFRAVISTVARDDGSAAAQPR